VYLVPAVPLQYRPIPAAPPAVAVKSCKKERKSFSVIEEGCQGISTTRYLPVAPRPLAVSEACRPTAPPAPIKHVCDANNQR
jgi:hypothetical protein